MIEQCNLQTNVRLPNLVFRPNALIGTNQMIFEKANRPRISGSGNTLCPRTGRLT